MGSGAGASGGGNSEKAVKISEGFGGAVGATAAIVGANEEAKAARAMGRFQRNQAFRNAKQAEKEAGRVTLLGRRASRQSLKQAGQMMGQQRAALAAQGIVVDDGVADVIQKQTKEIALEDALTIRNNAMREALGLKTQATQMRVQGQMDLAAAYRRAGGAKLAGTAAAVGSITSAVTGMAKAGG